MIRKISGFVLVMLVFTFGACGVERVDDQSPQEQSSITSNQVAAPAEEQPLFQQLIAQDDVSGGGGVGSPIPIGIKCGILSIKMICQNGGTCGCFFGIPSCSCL